MISVFDSSALALPIDIGNVRSLSTLQKITIRHVGKNKPRVQVLMNSCGLIRKLRYGMENAVCRLADVLA